MTDFAKRVAAATLATFFAVSLMATQAAAAAIVRWTAAEDTNGTIEHVIQLLNERTKDRLKVDDFKLDEDRALAFNHYRRYVQLADGAPIRGKSVRIWTELGNSQTVQVEAAVVPAAELTQMRRSLRVRGLSYQDLRGELTREETTQLAVQALQTTDDPSIRALDWNDAWEGHNLLRVVRVKSKRGSHEIKIDLDSQRVVDQSYQEYPQADLEVAAQVFPIYEETEKGKMQTRVPTVLKNILSDVPVVQGDLYAGLRTQRYWESKYDPVLGQTEAGRALGFWSPTYIKAQGAAIRAALPKRANTFDQGGMLLQGRYTSINIHPDALFAFGPFNFTPGVASPLLTNWVEDQDSGQWEMIPGTAFLGKPLLSASDAWDRPARRLANHDSREYINDGFDELQVYYAVDTLFSELHKRGFSDPELSTRPFNAFLFNPDISMRNNAFYTDDTINFTTYSSDAPNYARDNPTIWHELGHGVMDRLMGDNIQLADTGGLSEGMADFVAAMLVQAVTDGKPFDGSGDFRIINKMGFNLTNEVHDDGEAYGGAMKDFMDSVIARDGLVGLDKVSDVVLEGMRLTRDYPGLTAAEWFNHILFADQLGRAGLRKPGELRELLLAALAGRNFKFDSGTVAQFSLVNTHSKSEVVSGQPGSRQAPISVLLGKDDTAQFELSAGVMSSDAYPFQYPVTVKAQFRGGPIQGAVHWVGEETGTKTFVLHSEADRATIPLQVTGTCDEVNRPDGSCVDYVYVQVFNKGGDRPAAKKRFYLRVRNP